MNRGIGSWITKRALLSGERTAFVSGDRYFTYADVEERTNRLANALHEHGVHKGDRVAALLANSVEFMELLFACAKLGALFTPINTRLKPGEVGYVLADSGADVFAYHDGLSPVGRAALSRSDVRVRHAVRVGGIAGEDEFSYADLLASGDPATPPVGAYGSDVACLMYTSGTTGRPKGAMLTHDNMLWNVVNVLSFGRGLRETDSTVTVAPMFHIGGLGVHSLPLVYAGGTNVILPSFEPAETLDAIARTGATVQFLVPAMWAAMMHLPEFAEHDLSNLESAVAGGAPVPLAVIDFFQRHGVPFQEGFGMTETAPMVSMLGAEDVRRKAGSIGRPAFHVEARIVAADGSEAPIDTVGELVVRGPNIFIGYWMRRRDTAEAFRDGWFHTGDLGYRDSEGFFTLVDRKKDMIISGGENVYPIEVEQVLHDHPAVRDAAVLGLPHEKWGEVPVAVVVREVDRPIAVEEIVDWCRQHLAGFKVPKQVEFVSELPRNATGKVLKTELRARYDGASGNVPTG